MEQTQLKYILEAILLSADQPMDLRKLETLLASDEEQSPGRDSIAQALHALQDDYAGRGVELKEVASGYRMQVNNEFAPWVSRLWEEKPPRYSRALLETLVLIAYRQPITRGEIEEIRGVSVSSHIIKTLTEREWVRVLGHKDVPGRPSMYGTTREFLDYFNLKSLDELPSLADITDLDNLHPELSLEPEVDAEAAQDSQPETGETAENSAENTENGVDMESSAAKDQEDAENEQDSPELQAVAEAQGPAADDADHSHTREEASTTE